MILNHDQYYPNFIYSFIGENYDYWNIKINTFFCSQDLWDIVEGFIASTYTPTLIATPKKELKENKHKDSRMLFFPRIMDTINAKDAWSTLQKEF